MSAEASSGELPGDPDADPSGDPDPPAAVLVPFCFWLPRSSAGLPPGGSAAGDIQRPAPGDPAALSDAIGSHLAGLGWNDAEPLRWAITAVDPARGLQLEGVGVCAGPAVGRDQG